MTKFLPRILILLAATIGSCQTKPISSDLNLGFEDIKNGKPAGWSVFGDTSYIAVPDSANTKTGRYAGCLAAGKESKGFKAWGYTLPDRYPGKRITLSGYIKTDSVTDGYAGLWMRIDPSIAFDNMFNRGVTGTTGWTKYEITLDMNSAKATQIVFGGILTGKGRIWVDDLAITIDGKDISEVKPLVKQLLPAEADKEFIAGSKIATLTIDDSHVKDLKNLGMIWGFLKYYHPAVAKGQYNWDYELFRVLPRIMESKNKKNTDEVLVKWIESLGSFSAGKPFPSLVSGNVKAEPDLAWINRSGFSDTLTSLLLKVKNAKRNGDHFYIGLHPRVGNPDFKDENGYAQIVYPDAGFRMLALYRYWNIIQYYFPNKHLIGEDWKNVLEEFIPKINDTKNETEYTLAMLELIGRIHDTHANVWGNNAILNNYFGRRYAPVALTFIEGKPVVTGYYDERYGPETGLKTGDVITAINNKPVDQIIKEQLKYLPASNYPTQLRDLSNRLIRTNDSTLSIEFTRNKQSQKVSVKTFSEKEVNIYSKFISKDTCFRLINKDIAYINNGSVKKVYLPEIWKSVQHTKGLIIDIRNYPSDFVIYDLSAYLMPNSTPFVKFSQGSVEYPGLFTFRGPTSTGKKNSDYYKGKVVILVNELSQSSSEFHAMAYRVHPNATVIGSTTAGADGNISSFMLPGGISTMMSGIGIYYPDGKETQRVGIVPDIEVKPTIRGVKEGRDELMEAAIRIINQ